MFTGGEENFQCVKCFKAATVLAQDFKQCKQMLNMYPPSFIQFHPGSGRLVDSFVARPRHHIRVGEGVGPRDAIEKNNKIHLLVTLPTL